MSDIGKPTSCDEFRRAAGQVDHLADQVGVDLVSELVEVQVEVVDAGRELRGVVIAQIRRVEMLQVRRRAERTCPCVFDIFSPLTVRKPWMWTFSGRLKPAVFSIAGQKSVWK